MSVGGWKTFAIAPVKEVRKEIEVPGPIQIETIIKEVPVNQTLPAETAWIDLAWAQVLNEFEDDDLFYTCNGHEFDDDEYKIDLEDSSVKIAKNGDVTVSVTWEFDFDDNSDERDCKVDRNFEVFWDEDDIEDEDWNEAEVTWLNNHVLKIQ